MHSMQCCYCGRVGHLACECTLPRDIDIEALPAVAAEPADITFDLGPGLFLATTTTQEATR